MPSRVTLNLQWRSVVCSGQRLMVVNASLSAGESIALFLTPPLILFLSLVLLTHIFVARSPVAICARCLENLIRSVPHTVIEMRVSHSWPNKVSKGRCSFQPWLWAWRSPCVSMFQPYAQPFRRSIVGYLKTGDSPTKIKFTQLRTSPWRTQSGQ